MIVLSVTHISTRKADHLEPPSANGQTIRRFGAKYPHGYGRVKQDGGRADEIAKRFRQGFFGDEQRCCVVATVT